MREFRKHSFVELNYDIDYAIFIKVSFRVESVRRFARKSAGLGGRHY